MIGLPFSSPGRRDFGRAGPFRPHGATVTMSDTAAAPACWQPGWLPVHPAANIFPMMTADEYQAHKEDVRVNGQRAAVVRHGGAILDGRNRYRACMELGVEPKFEDYAGNDTVGYVVSHNLHRRQLSSSQRAALA